MHWRDHWLDILADELYLSRRLETVGERRILRGDESGWELLALALRDRARDEYLIELLDRRDPTDWQIAREYMIGGAS